MSYTVYTYLLYLAISLTLTFWVARTLFKNGRAFLVDIFRGNTDLAHSVNHLLVVGFYLINLGFVALALRVPYDVDSLKVSIEALAQSVGRVLLMLGLMHFFNLVVFSQLRYRMRLESNPPSGEPDACRAAGDSQKEGRS